MWSTQIASELELRRTDLDLTITYNNPFYAEFQGSIVSIELS